MITLIHGTDIASSRKYFVDLKNKEKGAISIDGQNVSLTDLVQVFEGGGLFDESKSYFIEQLFGKKKKSRELDQIIDYIKKNENENNIFIWEDKELTRAAISQFKNPILKLFKIPQNLFSFLESIQPGNGRSMISLFHQTLEEADAEMVFFMLVRQVRLLLALTEPGSDGIDEVKRMAPWQKGKITSQADRFEIGQLKLLYAKLFEIEKAVKTGNLPTSMTQSIDILLLEI